MIIAITDVTYGSKVREPKGALRYYYTHALEIENSKEELLIQMDFTDKLSKKNYTEVIGNEN
ncbi:hypothetical protein F9231_09905 [Bacillus safensis]|uniref:hypothetical protein n=1 Tax=Bacillus TaxID=1386 RepID=UPI000409A383|nr:MULTISPECIES: hypothetical protein [Bacillus]PNU23630.1 hypothetical protein C1954_08100 [Bacillus stratosphericus]KAB3539379.1 hypothetical protein F9229_09850 [Bacillus safensis]KAB3545011.1 hypothetical protein F9231_09905 [Bacillus safensis]MBI1628499.1 hypothetical protein [Bacillus safensis]MBS4743535.1 hypothetical protein [Bacillus safensis]